MLCLSQFELFHQRNMAWFGLEVTIGMTIYEILRIIPTTLVPLGPMDLDTKLGFLPCVESTAYSVSQSFSDVEA